MADLLQSSIPLAVTLTDGHRHNVTQLLLLHHEASSPITTGNPQTCLRDV